MQFTPTQKRAAAWLLIAALATLVLMALGPVLVRPSVLSTWRSITVAAAINPAITMPVMTIEISSSGRVMP